ncbi:MAG: fused MFS/spermidine synthase, partial [Roseiflexaceae bacterium]|nr:fused MFS/spermidine synthase [Roseiflexaceae bacterium]
PILRTAQAALAEVAVGGFLGALVGVLLLFAAPIILLAMVSPFAARLQLFKAGATLTTAGATVGTLSALSTIGSIVGTFLTVLLLIPWIGTTSTTLLYAGLLVLLGAVALRSRQAIIAVAVFVVLAMITLATVGGVKSAGCEGCTLIAEIESPYNYIQVGERPGSVGTQMVLMLNEGLAIHSIYNPRYEQSGDARDLLSNGGPWDYFGIVPFFYPNRDPATVRSLAMLGAGAGTVPAQFLAIYGSDAIVDSVEIDPQIIEAGRQYFGLHDVTTGSRYPNYRTYAQDARYWLATTNKQYDIVALDAYHQPYIPFHLTTVEFFQEARAHLTEQGAVVVNAGLGPDGDDRLGQAIAATMRAVFPEVYVIETKRQSNQMIVGLNRPVGDGWANMVANYQRISNPALRQILESVNVSERPVDPRYTPLTDDRAPIEALIDSLIFEQVAP